jgi:GNAT superfamily N-acetyltransferase
MIVREIMDNKESISGTILATLPEWFGIKSARDTYIHHASHAPMLGAELDESIIGYVSLEVHLGNNCEIHSMGVIPRWHRNGVGAALIEASAKWARSRGIGYLSVKTLSDKHPDENYAKTRSFYKACGFVPFEELPTLWGANLPCLMLVRPLDI